MVTLPSFFAASMILAHSAAGTALEAPLACAIAMPGPLAQATLANSSALAVAHQALRICVAGFFNRSFMRFLLLML